jgi:hypothetical protein
MPIFEVEKGGQIFEVDAPDMGSALRAFGIDESALDSAGRGMGNAMLWGGAPYLGGAVEYAMQGGAPGSFQQGYDRSDQATAKSEALHPDAYGAGALGGAATEAVLTGGPAVVQGLNALKQSPNAVKWVARQLMNYFIPGSGTVMEASAAARALDGGVRLARRGTTRQDITESLDRGARFKMTRDRQALTSEQYVKRYGPDSNSSRNARELERRLEIDKLARRRGNVINLTDGDPPPPPNF